LTSDAVCGIINLLKERVMKKFLINYRPAVHQGQENADNKSFAYSVEMEEQFANREEHDDSAGMSARDIESGQWKRFRWDRINSTVAI
tara:strand:+ start:125 stop:388 length:264 start_codon:yes stop_codon:yes gene_type:complete